MDPQLVTILVALIAPVAALGGVVVGQRMQRRTTREQLTEQLTEQRRRDELSRAREDRHRFADEKRAAYAAFLAEVEKYLRFNSRALGQLEVYMQDEAEHAPPADTDWTTPHKEKVRELNFIAQAIEADGEVLSRLIQLELIAPKNIWKQAQELRANLSGCDYYVFTRWNWEHAIERRKEVVSVQSNLREAMRVDLGSESGIGGHRS